MPTLLPALPSNNQPLKAPLHFPLLGLSEPDVGPPLSSGPFYPRTRTRTNTTPYGTEASAAEADAAAAASAVLATSSLGFTAPRP